MDVEGLKRFSVKKSGIGLFYRDGDFEIDNTIQFIIETVEIKLNQLSDENEELKKENEFLKKRCDEYWELFAKQGWIMITLNEGVNYEILEKRIQL